MKRHVQTTGVRNWSGDAFVELQREPLMALEAVLQDLGDCIVQGCQVSRREDGTYDVSSGYVALQGIDRGVMGDQSAQRILLMPFAGVQGVAMPMYIVPQETVVNRVYNDGASKPIAYVWQAVYSTSQPEAGGYVTLTAAGGRSWRDAMQDATHRMVSDAKINAWDAKADKSGTYPNMTVGHSSTADTATSAASATKATQDSEGNKISETYLKRSGGTMTGNLALSNEVRVNGAVGNLIGRFTWAGGVKAVVGNSQDTLALLSKDAATLNGSPIITGNGGVISGNLVQKKGNCAIHTDVASYRIPSQHKGWIALDCGLGNNIALVGYITLYGYYAGALSIQVSGYTYAEGISLTRDNWVTPRYGIYGSWYGDMPQVAFVKDGTTGRRYIIIGGDDFAWNAYDYVSLDKVVLGSLGNKTEALPFTWSALSGTYASLDLVAATAGDMSQGVEVQRARQDKDGNDIPSTYARKDEIPANLPPSGGASGDLKGSYPDPLVKQVTGEYTNTTSGYGGWNPPANFPKQKIQWRMMVASLKNKTLPFTNWMIMDPYSGEDINYLSGIGVTREATPRAFIVSGVRGGTEPSDWSDSLELATQTWVTSKLPAKATTEADGLMSKEDKASLGYLSDTAGKPVILAEVTSIPDAAGQACTINSRTADGVTVSIIRAVTGFTVQHNLNSTDYFVAITPIDSFNYTVGKSPTSFGIATSTKWPFDANSRAWGRFSVAVFKYK